MALRKKLLLPCLLISTLGSRPILAEQPTNAPINKLQYMYQFYYLPFSLEFRQGQTVNDILPFVTDNRGQPTRLIRANELEQLDKEWNHLKEPWKQKSLLLTTPVRVNGTVRISQHLVSHRISLSRTAFDVLPINDRIQLLATLRGKPAEVQASFKQLRHVRSFLNPIDEIRFNFFIFSASWCASCREYRVLFETYFKTFPDPNLTLHSVVIEDPREEIFDSSLLKELFPHREKYTHDSIPRFLAFEVVNGKPRLLEEGEAIKELYTRFFESHHGYLDPKSDLFRVLASEQRLSPIESSLSSFLK